MPASLVGQQVSVELDTLLAIIGKAFVVGVVGAALLKVLVDLIRWMFGKGHQ